MLATQLVVCDNPTSLRKIKYLICKDMRMYNKFFSVKIMALAISTNVFASESITQSCESFTVEDNTVSAFCMDQNGDYNLSTITLRGLENINGKLVPKNKDVPANFHDSCDELSLGDYGVLSAKCKTRDGSIVETSIDLSLLLVNDNGSLLDKRFDND